MLIILVGIYINYQVGKNEEVYYVSILYIERGENSLELKVRSSDKVTLLVENGKESVFTTIKREGKERLSLPDLSKVESINTLEDRRQKSKLLWELTFMDSFRYITYLIQEEGYTLEMYAATQQYIEVFLENDGLYTRVIVFRDSLMVSEMSEGVELPNFESYVEEYRLFKK